MLRAIDLYCGAGGTTTGAQLSGRVQVTHAINHWRTAIFTHENNHPETKHICAPIDHVDPRDFLREKIDVILASPECTGHSNARGGRPTSDQKRAGGWDVLKWVETLRPTWLVVENVREWLDWGPLGADGKPLKSKKGQFFRTWVKGLEAANYRVEWRLLNAADYGEATSRVRLFVIARANRRAINWPVPTHAKDRWRPAAEIIDWTLPCPSIFGRKRPLVDNTLRRIEIGIKKFGTGPDGRPFIVKLRGTGTTSDVLNPLPTVTGGGRHEALATPFLVPNFGERKGQEPRTHAIDQPLPAVTSHGAGQLCLPFFLPHRGFHCHKTPLKPDPRSLDQPLPTLVSSQGPGHLVMPYLVDVNHGEKGRSAGGRVHSLDKPLGTLTGSRGKAICLPFITEYYGTAGARSVEEPLSTVTTKPRHGLAMVSLIETMREFGIADIGFRMLALSELLAAQGFPRGYKLHGNVEDQTKQIGNSVCVRVAKAICEAIAAA